jgi:tryptophan-rich hypothetical protein
MSLPRRYAHLIGSKFTATAPIDGWSQFHVVGLRKVEGGYDAELRASCEANVELRVPAKSLFNPEAWSRGWKLLSELSQAPSELISCSSVPGSGAWPVSAAVVNEKSPPAGPIATWAVSPNS